MTTTALGAVLHHLRRSALRQEEGHTDGDLLEGFVTRRDEAAFEALVRRHGPMVLGVCRRVLRNEADVEDAFQATFLVLVRKAPTVRPRGMVGNWLYGVAHTTALKARAMNAKRLARERAAAARPKPEAAADTAEPLQALLDQELKLLPDRYRSAIVLCDLEGKSIKEAARHLGCPPGTVGTRLARGRRLLARRLARHGLVLSGGTLAAGIARHAPAAGVPPLLVNSTVRIAALFAAGPAAPGAISANVTALTEGVLQAMLLGKLKTISGLILVVVVLGAGFGTVGRGPTAVAQDRGLSAPGAARTPRRPIGFTEPDPTTPFIPPAQERAARSRARAAQEVWTRASVGGRYSLLLKKIDVPEDRNEYSNFHDYGWWDGTSYAGHDDLPAGYWVYVAPHWYIWGAKDAPESAQAKKATVGGRYRILLKKIEVRDDREEYTAFNDFGWWEGRSYAGHDDLPVGYWVYVAPHWYVWGVQGAGRLGDSQRQSGAAGPRRRPPGAEASRSADLKKASVGGRYRRLLKRIEVKSDRAGYGDFMDYGHGHFPEYAGYDDLPDGYWVYVYPYWYIWGEVRK